MWWFTPNQASAKRESLAEELPKASLWRWRVDKPLIRAYNSVLGVAP